MLRFQASHVVCIVYRGLDECLHVDWRRNHENSPCAKAAPLFFDTLEASAMCGKEDSKYGCESNRQCAWYNPSVVSACHRPTGDIVSGLQWMRLVLPIVSCSCPE